jgi:hypothetical protein
MKGQATEKSKVYFIVFAVLLFLTFPVVADETDGYDGAQTEDGVPEDDAPEDGGQNTPGLDTDWSKVSYSTYTFGDQAFTISMGLLFPAGFTSTSGASMTNNVKLGGTGALSYWLFLSQDFFAALEVSGSFSSTLAENMIYMIPLGIKGGYQFVLGRFEFPVSLTLGMIWHHYMKDRLYYGFYLKPQLAVYWRYNQDWSFGLSSAYWWVPEFNENPARSAFGHFVELTLSARYHF